MNRRGYALVEIIVAIGVIGIVANLSARLIHGMFDTNHAIIEEDRVTSAADQAVRLLRRDVQHATSVLAANGAVTLDGVTWSTDGDALLRRENDQTRRFEGLPSPSLSATGGVVTLRLGDAVWTTRPLLSEDRS